MKERIGSSHWGNLFSSVSFRLRLSGNLIPMKSGFVLKMSISRCGNLPKQRMMWKSCGEGARVDYSILYCTYDTGRMMLKSCGRGSSGGLYYTITIRILY